MQNLLEKLKLNNIETAIEQENNDFQFLSLTKLYQNIENKKIYLFLILLNNDYNINYLLDYKMIFLCK